MAAGVWVACIHTVHTHQQSQRLCLFCTKEMNGWIMSPSVGTWAGKRTVRQPRRDSGCRDATLCPSWLLCSFLRNFASHHFATMIEDRFFLSPPPPVFVWMTALGTLASDVVIKAALGSMWCKVSTVHVHPLPESPCLATCYMLAACRQWVIQGRVRGVRREAGSVGKYPSLAGTSLAGTSLAGTMIKQSWIWV